LAVLSIVAHPCPAAAEAAGFKDVPSSHPYHIQIETLAQLGIIEGYPDGTYRPDAPVTRQQLAKLIIKAMCIAVSEADVCGFADVARSGVAGLYPDNYVAAAARVGIVTGYVTGSNRSFKPGMQVTLAQLVSICTRASARALKTPPDSYETAWGDFDRVHAPIAATAQYNGLLRGLATPGKSLKSFSPWKAATRGQAAALIFNVMGTDPDAVCGRFLGDASDLVRYFLAHSGGDDGKFTVSLETLADYYVLYGDRFGIRADIAWAQMIRETGWGGYGGLVSPEQNNMAGIGATGPGVPGNSFATAELGVIAQYAHLAWYVFPAHVSDPYCVKVSQPADGPITTPGDPRHFSQADGSAHKGTVRTVGDLSGTWAADPAYGSALRQLAEDVDLTCGLW